MAGIAELLTDAFHIELEFTCESEPDSHLRVADFSLTEALSETYCAELELITEDAVEATKMLGRNGTFTLRRGGAERLVHGMVTRVEHGGVASIGTHNAMLLHVRLEPALCAFKHTLDSRIFQNQTAVEIIEMVLKTTLSSYGRGLDIEKLKRVYEKREYTVQYSESDYDFVSRLAAQEGITFYFDHTEANEKIIFADDNADFQTFETVDGQPVPLARRADENPRTESLTSFCREDQQGSTSSVTRDYDWSRPTLPLKVEHLVPDAQGKERTVYNSTAEIVIGSYDLGQKTYTITDEVTRAQLLQERLHALDATFVGEGMVTGFSPGRVFELTDHVLPDLDGRYVITSVTHNGGSSAESEVARDRYVNHFTAVRFDGVYRPPVVTPWPRIHSIQTATVVGPESSEIHTDEHGRIRVQFHWDRKGTRDDHSSCFIRVAQQWAGSGYGFVFIPRIGHEVLVSFIEGNPDRPLVVGSVYNGDNNPFWELAKNETRSVIRTKTFGTAPPATGYNEISFEDATDAEEILLHASRDFNETVEKDHNTTVHGKHSNTVDKSDSESVGGSQSLSVGGDRSHTVTGKEDITVKKDRTVTVVGTETRDITKDLTENYHAKRTTTVTGADDETCEATKKITVTGTTDLISKGAVTIAQNETSVLKLDGVFDLATPGKMNMTNDKTTLTGEGGKLTLDSANEISVVCGSATMTLKSDGTIEVSGSTVTVKGTTAVELGVGSSVIKVEAAQITVSAPKIASTAIGIHEIQGAVVKVG
jgi:type VI secretion system secreted protein VgrG